MLTTINPTALAVLDSVKTSRPSRSARRKLAAKIESATTPVVTELPVDEIKRAEDRQKAAVAAKHTADVKPAAKEPKIKKKEVTPSEAVAAIRSCASALGIAIKPFGKNGDSFVMKLGTIGAFLASLPKTGATAEARAFIALHNTVAGFTKGDANTTWVFHRAGSFALYSKM